MHLGPVAAGMERNGEETDLGDRNRAARARNDERDRLRNDKAGGLGRDHRSGGRAGAPGSRARLARGDPDAQPAADPRYADRAAGDVQPRRSQSRAGEGHDRSERAGGADRSDSGVAGCDRAQGDRRGPGIALHDKSRFAGRGPHPRRCRRRSPRRRRYGITQGRRRSGAATASAGHRRSARGLLAGSRGGRICRDCRRIRDRQKHDPGGGARRLRSLRLPGHRHGLDQCRRAEPRA